MAGQIARCFRPGRVHGTAIATNGLFWTDLMGPALCELCTAWLFKKKTTPSNHVTNWMPPYSSHRLLIASITTKAVWKARRENTDYFAKLGGVTSGRMKGVGGESLSEIHGFERDEWISLDCCCFTRHRVWEGLAKILIQITEATGSEDEHPHLFRQWSQLHGPGGGGGGGNYY